MYNTFSNFKIKTRLYNDISFHDCQGIVSYNTKRRILMLWRISVKSKETRIKITFILADDLCEDHLVKVCHTLTLFWIFDSEGDFCITKIHFFVKISQVKNLYAIFWISCSFSISISRINFTCIYSLMIYYECYLSVVKC